MKYSNDYNSILTIKENRTKTLINALSITQTIMHAALEAGVSERTMFSFMEKNNINIEILRLIRKEFTLSKKKIKLQFIPIVNGKETTYYKNPEIKKRPFMVSFQNRSRFQSEESRR